MLLSIASISAACAVAVAAASPSQTADGMEVDRQGPRERQCRVTLPNGRTPPGVRRGSLFHGNGLLFTLLSPRGVTVVRKQFIRPNGAISIKFPWWANGPMGQMRLTARRLDGSSPSARGSANPGWPDGFEGTAFWASSIVFPSRGCWRVTARVGQASLSFVTRLVRNRAPQTTRDERRGSSSTWPRQPPTSPPGSRSAYSHSRSACCSTPSSAAPHRHSPPATAGSSHQASDRLRVYAGSTCAPSSVVGHHPRLANSVDSWGFARPGSTCRDT